MTLSDSQSGMYDGRRPLLVARESGRGKGAQKDLFTLVEAVLQDGRPFAQSLPKTEEVMELFNDPVGDRVERFPARKSKTVLIRCGEVDFLVSLGSARKVDQAGENEFVATLCNLLRRDDYGVVVSMTVSRLVRSTRVAGELEHIFDRYRIAVVVDRQTIEVWTESGRERWNREVEFATSEAAHIERRLTRGKVRSSERGVWAMGYAPPWGWTQDDEGRLIPDLEGAEVARFVISRLLAGEANLREIGRQTLTRYSNLESRRGGGLVADQREVSQWVRRTVLSPNALEAYSTNTYSTLIVPDNVKEAAAFAEQRGRSLDPAEETEVTEILVSLPPHPEPVATEAEIAQVREILDRLAENRTRPRLACGGIDIQVVEASAVDYVAPTKSEPGPTYPGELQWRAKILASDLRLVRGPADTGKEARDSDQHLATCQFDRFVAAIAEGLIETLDNGTEAHILRTTIGSEGSNLPTDEEVGKYRKQVAALESEIQELDDSAEAIPSELGRRTLNDQAERLRVKRDNLLNAISQAESEAQTLGPIVAVGISEILTTLADAVKGNNGAAEALNSILGRLRPTRIEPLTIHFAADLHLLGDGEPIRVPFEFTVENTHRHPSPLRPKAMAEHCLVQGLPVTTVAQGIPLANAGIRRRDLVARELSRILKPSIGSKAASVVGGCEVTEVLVALGKHLNLLSVERHLDPDLEQRILDTYVHGTPPGPKAWMQATDQSDIAGLIVEIHSEGSAPAQHMPPWQRRYFDEKHGRFLAPICRCGSADLAYIAAPEPDGLVCMACRKDRSGLVFPGSWNAALIHASYWANLGYSTDPAPIPVKSTHFVDALLAR